MFENSSIFCFLPQQESNANKIAELFSLSGTQREKIVPSAQEGTGLVIVDGVRIAMTNRIPSDNALYELWNTDPYKLAEQEAKEVG